MPNSSTIANIQHLLNIVEPSPVQRLQLPEQPNILLDIKRDDRLHPVISGNKWRKLKYALVDAVENKVEHITSFGGGYSNHLHALAFACRQLSIPMTAIVRGDYSQNLTPMLTDILSWGSNIQYVDRKTYQMREDKNFVDSLLKQNANGVVIPEGGSQDSALRGISEIINELENSYDYIVAPVGSGGTLAGLIKGVSGSPTKILGVGVLKGQDYLEGLVTALLPNHGNFSQWQINHNYHFGGYAKSNEQLDDFCQRFHLQHEIQIEPVYSGKMFFATYDLIAKKHFPKNSRVLAIHTGGLQGKRVK